MVRVEWGESWGALRLERGEVEWGEMGCGKGGVG